MRDDPAAFIVVSIMAMGIVVAFSVKFSERNMWQEAVLNGKISIVTNETVSVKIVD